MMKKPKRKNPCSKRRKRIFHKMCKKSLLISMAKKQNKVVCKTVYLKDLFAVNLSIPPYQRGYCWRKENIIKFLEAIYFEIQKHLPTNENKKLPPYHIGTIILKKKGINFDIIDGQQRLITLSILFYCLGNIEDNFAEKLLSQCIENTENVFLEHIGYIKRAQKTIDEWLKIHKITAETLLSSICVCLIIIPENESEDLAYRFFNAANATGIRLSDHDLLKTHHLRHVSDSQAGFFASRWNTMNKKDKKTLLDDTLYYLRNWSYGNTFEISRNDSDRFIFEHYSVKYDSIKNIYSMPLPQQYNSTFSGGADFFSFVEKYKVQYNIFHSIECIEKLDSHLRRHSDGVLCLGIKAITFLFYIKFGGMYVSEALFCISIRISVLRNKYGIGMSDLIKEDVFREVLQMIDISTTENMFFAYCLSAQFKYTRVNEGATKCSYWKSLNELLKYLHEKHEFQLKSQCEIYLEN